MGKKIKIAVEEERKLALLSCYHKNPKLRVFSEWLISKGFDLMASGGTFAFLRDAGLEVQNVADFVGGRAILGDQEVILSREIMAALLCRMDNISDMDKMAKSGIRPIDLAFVDVYPLKRSIDSPNATVESVMEAIDIGGLTIIRAAAKGRRIVLTDYNQVSRFMKIWDDHRGLLEGLPGADPRWLAAVAEYVVAQYSLRSAEYIYRAVGDHRSAMLIDLMLEKE